MKSFALLFFCRIFAVPNEGTRGVAQLASASGLGPEGPVFESQYPDNRAVDFQLLFFLFTFDPASSALHYLSIKTGIFVDGLMLLKSVSIKTGIFVDGLMFLKSVSIKTDLFMDRGKF